MRIALTRDVSPAMDRCELSHLARSPIDHARAVAQHAAYEQCLMELGCRVHRVPADASMPDAVFIEDTAVVVDELAVVARPGAASRRGESAEVAPALAAYESDGLTAFRARPLAVEIILTIVITMFLIRTLGQAAVGRVSPQDVRPSPAPAPTFKLAESPARAKSFSPSKRNAPETKPVPKLAPPSIAACIAGRLPAGQTRSGREGIGADR